MKTELSGAEHTLIDTQEEIKNLKTELVNKVNELSGAEHTLQDKLKEKKLLSDAYDKLQEKYNQLDSKNTP